MAAAYEAVQSGKMSIKRAAKNFGVKRTTLRRRLVAKNPTAPPRGRPSFLTPAIEAQILKHIIAADDDAHGYTTKQLSVSVAGIAKVYGVFEKGVFVAGKDFVKSYLKRHPVVKLTRPTKRNWARATKMNRVNHTKWVGTYEELIAMFRPEEIFNADDKHFDIEKMLPQKVRLTIER